MRRRAVSEDRFPARFGRAPVGLRRLFSTGEAPTEPVPDGPDEDFAASLLPDESENSLVRGLMNALPPVGPEPARRSDDPPDAPAGGEERRDWSATLGLVQRAVAAVKASEERVTDLDARSREVADRFEEERRVARARIIAAESRAEEAEFRVRETENYVRELETRADDLQRELEDTRVRAKDAEARALEAETWLKRLHDALMDQTFAQAREAERQRTGG